MKKKYNQQGTQTSSSPILAAICLILMLGFGTNLKAQLTGTKTIPGDYTDLAAAITDLNTQGVGAGGVTFDLLAGNPQTAPAGGYVINTNGTAANPIVFNGNANTITSSNALTVGSLNDAIIKLVGADYVTIQGFVLQEDAANTVASPAASNTMTEWGIALLYNTATDGAQFNTIQNNTISLNRTYANTFGIYSNTRHTAAAPTTTADITAATGANSNNKVYGNTINNVNMGIAFIGSGTAANQDAGNDIGGTSMSTGNTITNWGGAAALSSYVSNSGTSYCIFMNHQKDDNVSYNTITSAAVSGTSVTFRGIYKDYTATSATGTFTSSITNNTITLNSGFTSGTFEHIRSQGLTTLSTATININSNKILNSTLTGASTSSNFIGIVNSSVPGVLNMNNNIFQGNSSTTTTAGFTGISNTGAVVTTVNINNNQIGNATGGAITFGVANSGTVTAISNTGGATTSTVTISGNDVRGIVHSAAASATHTYITQTAAALVATVSNNTFTNLNVNTTGATTFINHGYSIPSGSQLIISGNSIVTAFNRPGTSGSVILTTSNSTSGTGSVNNYLNNNFSNITLAGSTTFTGFNNTDGGTGSTKTITGNTISNLTGGTGTINCMNFTYWNGTSSLSNNTISTITGQANITGVTIGSTANNATLITVATNTVTGLSSTGTGGTVTGLTCANTSTAISITGNIVNTLSSTGSSSTVSGIIVSGAANTTVSGNIVNGILANGTTSPVARGIAMTGGTTVNISKNKVYDIQANNAGASALGMLISGGTTANVNNNYVGDVKAPAASGTNPVIGISLTGGTTDNIYYNTVYLNTTSTGTNFGSSALSTTTGPGTIVLRNNIFVNKSTAAGTGLTAAFRRSSTALTNYSTSSNNNAWYAGAPSASSLIFYDGTNSYQTLVAFKAAVSTREAASVTEDVPFVSTTGSASTFLHVNTATQTYTESGAVNIGGITDDFDADIRQGNGGYAGTGTAPDIGADEFNGTPYPQCAGTPVVPTISGVTAVCSGSGTTLTLTGTSTDLGLTYQWASSTTAGGPYTNMGTAQTQATGNLTVTTYYIATTTCTNGGATSTTAEYTLTINPLPTVTVTPTTAQFCTPSGTPVALTASGASTYAWSPSAGLSATTGASVNASPSVNTTYSVTGTSASGCVSATAATATITVSNAPSTLTVTATPASVCSGANSQLTAASNPVYNNNVSGYSFAATSGTFTPLTGATVIPSGSISGDDFMVGNIPIGFTFPYGATTFSVLAISSNGNIQLGQTASATNGTITIYTNSLVANANILGPLWDDNNTTGATVSYLLQGTAPNQTFTIEYLNVHIGNGGSSTSSTINMQVIISQNGTIQFIYGSTSGALTSTTASIGISGSAGAYLSVTPLSPVASTTVSSSSENSTISSATNFPSGTIYTFTPPVPPTLTYSWSPATFLSATNISNPMATGITATTTYTATATTAAGCAVTNTVTITAGSPLTSAASVTPSNTVCVGTNITLNAIPTGGGAPYTYAWTGPNSFTSTSQNPAITGVTAAAAGTYTVVISDACGANSTAMVTLTTNALPTVAVTPASGAVCNPGGTAVALAASGASTYTWTPSAGLSATSGANVTANPSSTTIYTVTGTDANGCSVAASATVGVGPAPVLSSVTASPNAVCNGGSSQLNAAGGFPAFTYCASTHTNCSGDEITNVTLGSINNTTGTTCGGASHYTDVAPSATTTTTLTPAGGTYTVSLTFGTDGNQYFGAWIDYDQDGTFAAGEFLGASANAGGSGTIGVNFTVPPTAYNGTTKMRIVGGNDAAVTATQACGASSSIWGETQDYVVTITGGVDPFTYSWSPSTYLSSATVSNPMATAIMSSITYTATLTSGIGCAVTGTVAISAGTALTSAANATPSNTVCVGTNTSLHAVPTGGGGPYTYAWTGPNGFTSVAQDTTLNAITLAQAGTYSVTITDNCGANSMATFALTVNANPVVSVNTTAASICLPGGSAVSITASGAPTFSWTPSAGLSATTGASVTANPGATTTYTVTGTDANGCIGTATSTISVGAKPSFVSITATPSTICTGGTSQLQATATISAPVNISEVTLFRGGTGSGVYPAFVVGQDLVELSNNLSTTIDISGYTLSAFGNNSATASHTITFPVGTTIPAGAVVVVHIGTGTNDVANRYYNTGGTTDSYFSSSQMGVVLYNGATVVDAVGMGAGIGYTFNAATGVTSLDFSGYAPNVGGNAGVIRTATIDSNTGADWVSSTGSLSQTIGVFNMVYSAPGSVNYAWVPAANLNDDSIANPLATLTTTTVYTVTATSSIGCTNTGSVTVTVSPLSSVNIAAAPSTPICVGASVVLSSTPVGGGPYTYSWMPGGATTPSYTVSPTTTTVYTLTVMNSCGETVTNTATVNVNQLPVVTATAPGTLYCNPGAAVVLTGGGASTYSWTPSSGLDVTNTATPNATPTVTTTYTVTGTDANGCVNTASITITTASTPTVTAMATPSTPVCAGTPVQLSSTAIIPMTYVQSVTGFNPEICAANAGPTGDDAIQGPNAIGFSFTYYGVTYTQFAISTNGNIQLGNGSGSTNNPTYSNAWTDVAIPNTATPNNMVALAWDDWYINAGEIKWGVTGTSPNQKLVICYATTGRGGGSADTLQGQIVLEETTNNVILNTIKKGIQPLNTATQGIEDATGSSASMAVSGRNNQAWSANFETRVFSPYLGTYTYNWTPAADLDTATIATPIARLQTSTTFTFTATEVSGCSANATVAVTVNPLPVVALGVDTAICSVGAPITLDATNAGSTYAWNTAETTQTISVDTTGSYNVSVTDANGCVGVDTISVTVNTSPVVNLGIDTVRCGGSVTLDAGNMGSTYAWSDATSGQTTTVSSTGSYDVVVTTPQGCAGYDTVMVTINTIPTVNIGNDTLFCGTNMTLDAGNAGSSYFWNTTEITQTINVTTTGQYFVEVTTPQNCSSRDTINVTIAPAITVNLGTDSAVCSSTSLILDAENPGSTYLWNDNTTSSTLIVTTPGVYSVFVTSPDGCTGQDTIVFTDNSPIVDLTLPFSITCVTSTVNALSGGSPVGGFYSGLGVAGTNFNAATAGVGSHVITYSYTDGTTGCFATDTQSVVVDPCVGIKELSTVASIVIAPNPTTGYFSINMPSRDNVLKAEMYTVEGQLISSEIYKGREVYEVNITSLANAVYYLRLTVDGETNVVKIVKQQ